jgi:hypothetical protein
MYDVRINHFRDIYGAFLWAEPAKEEYRLYEVGEVFEVNEVQYKVERIAIADNTQHINVTLVEEDLKVTEPFL